MSYLKLIHFDDNNKKYIIFYFQISASAFAIFKFSQSLSAAIAFFYSIELSLYYQVTKSYYVYYWTISLIF